MDIEKIKANTEKLVGCALVPCFMGFAIASILFGPSIHKGLSLVRHFLYGKDKA